MVKTMQIDLAKGSKINLDKTTNNINLTKTSDGSIQFAKKTSVPDQINLLNKAPKPPGGLPDINFTEPVDNLTKIPIQPFELYWTDQTAEPDYPDGLPFSFLPIGLEPEIVLDSCHIGIGVQPVLGFIKLPQQQIVLKYAECDPNTPPQPPKPSPTPNSVFQPEPPPGCYYLTFWTQTRYVDYCFGNIEPEFENISYEYSSGDYTLPSPLTEVTESVTINTPFDDDYANYYKNYYYKGRPREQAIRGMRPLYDRPDLIDTYTLLRTGQDGTVLLGEGISYYGTLDDPIMQGNYTETGTVVYYETYTPDGEREEYGSSKGHIKTTEIVRARTYGGEITPVVPLQAFEQRSNYFTTPKFGYATSILICDDVPYDYTQNNPPPPVPLPPPPKQPKKKKMDCCPQVLALLKYLTLRVSEIDERVKTLDEQVKKTNKCLGTEEYPASLPASLISKDQGWLGNIIPDQPIQVPSLTRLVTQFIKYFDEVAGQWEIPIEVKDSDPLTPGDQPVGIKLPNIAEYAAESFLLQFRGAIDQATMLNMMTRILVEVGQIKQQDYRAYGLLQTLTDYLGFDYSEAQKDLPLSFDPSKESFEEMLKEVVLKVPYPEYTEKYDFRTDLRRIMEAVSIIKAVHWRKVPGGNDPETMKAFIIKTIKDRAKQIKDEEDKNKNDFDEFLQDVEEGFSDVTGIPDPTLPYGKPFAQRPKITKLKEE